MIRALLRLVLALVLAACAENAPTAEPSATDTAVSPSASASGDISPSEPASPAPTADPSMTIVYVNEAQGWSIGMPDGWEALHETDSGAILGGDEGFVEILLAPATGLTPEQREAQRVADISSSWGVDEIDSEVVSLPAGEAVRLMFEMGTASHPRAWYIFYVFEEGDTQYVMSVRDSKDNDELRAMAEALADSFAILD